MLKLFIEGVALCAPGLDGWENSRSVLAGRKEYESKDILPYKPEQLPRNEKRRASDTVKLAFRIGEEIKKQTDSDFVNCASVFSSSGGDYPIIHQICESICTKEKYISPTRFHNSVHNAPAGYWAIAIASHEKSVSISAYDDSFLFGLIEAATVVAIDNLPVLFVAYDILPSFPLSEVRKITSPFAMGLLLSPEKTDRSVSCLEINLNKGKVGSGSSLPKVESLWPLYQSNPIARSIPFLELLALSESGKVVYLPETYSEGSAYILNLEPVS